MIYVYMGFLDFLAGIFVGIFDKILKPVLKEAFLVIVNLINDILIQALSKLWMLILQFLLKVIDIIQIVFYIALGVSPVTYQGKTEGLIETILFDSGFRSVHFKLLFIAVVLAFIFTICAMMKATSESVTGGRLTPAKVLRSAARTCVNLIVVPLILIIVIQMSTKTLRVINTAFVSSQVGSTVEAQTGTMPSLGTIIFLNGTMNDYSNVSEGEQPSFTTGIRRQYYLGLNGKNYGNGVNSIAKDFNLKNYDFFTSIVSAGFVGLVMIANFFILMRRVIEILLLYLVAPFVTAAIPIDGGALFNEWKGMYTSRTFLAIGSIFTINIYMIIVQFVSNNAFSFGFQQNIFPSYNGFSIDSLLKLAFIIGGAYAMSAAQTTILTIFSYALAAGVGGTLLDLQSKTFHGLTSFMNGTLSQPKGEEDESKAKDPEFFPANVTGADAFANQQAQLAAADKAAAEQQQGQG